MAAEKNNNWPAVISLCCAIFVVNTCEFMPIGILPEISLALNVSIAQTGMLITAYAWCVSLISLPLTICVANFERKKLLLALFLVFILFNLAAAMAGSFNGLFFARLGTACTHALFFAITIPLAFRQVTAEKQNLAMSLMVAASSLAVIIGVPLGTFVGNLFNWRAAFLLVTAGASILLPAIFYYLPQSKPTSPGSLRSIPLLLQRKKLLLVYLLLLLTICGYFTFYTYIKPFMRQLGGMSETQIIVLLTAIGTAGLGGSFLFAKFYQRREIFCLILSFGLITVALATAGLVKSTWWYGFLCACSISATLTIISSALQTKTINFAPDATDVATALFSTLFNVGIGSGALIGATIINHLPLTAIGPISAVITGAALSLYVYFRHRLVIRR